METSELLEIISKRLIRPSSPTNPSLRSHKISYLDQTMPNIYNPLVFFFYPNDILGSHEISAMLQRSLSKTLTYYYPFAGRLSNNLFVDCNDMGVELTEARIKCRMSEIINKPNSHLEQAVFPVSTTSASQTINPVIASNPAGESSPPLALFQLNYFDCGGLALSALMSHKIADASSLCTFFNDWAAVARRQLKSIDDNHVDNHIQMPSPDQFIIGASSFPPVEDPAFKEYILPERETCLTRRFLFHSSIISQLKALAAESGLGVDHPTRAEVVTALLLKCAMSLPRADSAGSSIRRPSLLRMAANLRLMTNPPLPRNSIGNFVVTCPVLVLEEDELTFSELVSKLRNGRKKIQDEYKEKHILKLYEGFQSTFASREAMINHVKKFDIYQSSSVCGFPFYDVDFGWGRPSLVRYPTKFGQRNTFILMDLRNGEENANGIQAVVTLEKEDMCLFEVDEELLSYASLYG